MCAPESARPWPEPYRMRVATAGDVPAVVRLINAAFRVEQPFIEGDRIDAGGVNT